MALTTSTITGRVPLPTDEKLLQKKVSSGSGYVEVSDVRLTDMSH